VSGPESATIRQPNPAIDRRAGGWISISLQIVGQNEAPDGGVGCGIVVICGEAGHPAFYRRAGGGIFISLKIESQDHPPDRVIG
jgi:hypothetical protein